MRSASRIAGRIGLWVVAIIGGFWLTVFVITAFTTDDGDTRGGCIMLAVPSAAVLAAGIYGLRHTRRIRLLAERTSPAVLDRAFAGVRERRAVVLYPSRRRWTTMLVTFAATAAICGYGAVDTRGAGLIAAALFCGAVALLSAAQLIPSRAYLRIARDGLTARSPLRTHRWAWNDIEHFKAYEIHNRYSSTKHVGFDRRDLTPERQGLWRTLNRGIAGVDGGLPDTYGLDHRDLAKLLNAARRKYATEHGISASERADRALLARAAHVRADRIPAITTILTVACIAAFAAEAARSGPFPTTDEVLDAGGASREALADGRWWTLLSANVLHANPIHLVVNLAGFALLGRLLEREVGWPRFGALCLVGGVAAMAGAVLLQIGAGTVGISGVIFAVSGWAVIRDTHRTRVLGGVAWATLPVGVIYTFLTPGISIGAHLGGLLAGLGFGRAMERRTEPAGSALARTG
jgi:membrane associated rhomboid family serine protease